MTPRGSGTEPVAVPQEEAKPQVTRVTIATGRLDGLYYPIGSAICRYATEIWRKSGTVEWCRCAAVPTEGSQDNLSMLAGGAVDYAILQRDVWQAGANTSSFAKVEDLHMEDFLMIVADDSIQTPMDLFDFKRGNAPIYAGVKGAGHPTTLGIAARQLGWFKSSNYTGNGFADFEGFADDPKVSEEIWQEIHDLPPLPDDDAAVQSPVSSLTLGERLCLEAGNPDKLSGVVLTIGRTAPMLEKIFADCPKARFLDIKTTGGASFRTTTEVTFDIQSWSSRKETFQTWETFQMRAVLVKRNGNGALLPLPKNHDQTLTDAEKKSLKDRLWAHLWAAGAPREDKADAADRPTD